jgi:hypothetical protein
MGNYNVRGSAVPVYVWKSGFADVGNLLMTMLFAVMDPLLVFMCASYTSVFYDGVLTLEEQWDVVIDGVEKGTIPDVYDIDYCRPFLEVWNLIFLFRFGLILTRIGKAQIKPNPHRAAELRSIQKGTEGWLK